MFSIKEIDLDVQRDFLWRKSTIATVSRETDFEHENFYSEKDWLISISKKGHMLN